jgi:hypothetical protein
MLLGLKCIKLWTWRFEYNQTEAWGTFEATGSKKNRKRGYQ